MAFDPLDKKKNRKRAPMALWLLPLALLLVGAGVLVKLYEGEKPQVDLAGDFSYLGTQEKLGVTVTDAKSGLQSVELVLRQGEKQVPLLEKSFPRQGYFGRPGPARLEETVEPDMKSLGLAEGPAELVLTARDFSFANWLAGNETRRSYQVVIDTKPPVLQVLDATRYIRNGGSGMVVYRASEPLQTNGVELNGHFHPGHPLAGRGEGVYVAFVALPFDAKAIDSVSVTGTDDAGNTGMAGAAMIFKEKPLHADRINLGDGFLNLKIPEFMSHYPELTGTTLEKYLELNNRVRQENNARIREVCSHSLPDRAWEGAFSRMARSSRRSGFADHRSYYYRGQKVDEQYHLGLDLASVKQAEVEAANNGTVVMAEYLGIYGNTVILDHGQGVFSLYAHLSRIDAQVGDVLKKDAVLGLSGTTGMAGGDHLHFSMLVNGLFVDPVEWWDPHWLKVSVLEFL